MEMEILKHIVNRDECFRTLNSFGRKIFRVFNCKRKILIVMESF